jgi:hypothetical protein
MEKTIKFKLQLDDALAANQMVDHRRVNELHEAGADNDDQRLQNVARVGGRPTLQSAEATDQIDQDSNG